jgi:Fe-Mn family superoxide dismutase
MGKHVLPRLPYGYAALEPHIDARTMALHHRAHHASYVEKLNTALAPYPELQNETALWLLLNPHRLPRDIRTAIRDNAGGHVNHSLYWEAMSPSGGGAPSGALGTAIAQDFGSFRAFKERFDDAGAALLGSGWVWLTSAPEEGGRLEVMTTAGHDHPMTQCRFPVLLNDAWEHAYYLKHENRRAQYLNGWWSVVNWREAALRYDRAIAAEPMEAL